MCISPRSSRLPGGPLSVAFTGPAEAITTGSTAVVGAAVVSFLAGQLTKGVGPAPGGGDDGSAQIPAPPSPPPVHLDPPYLPAPASGRS